jgi:hypothetical protein
MSAVSIDCEGWHQTAAAEADNSPLHLMRLSSSLLCLHHLQQASGHVRSELLVIGKWVNTLKFHSDALSAMFTIPLIHLQNLPKLRFLVIVLYKFCENYRKKNTEMHCF